MKPWEQRVRDSFRKPAAGRVEKAGRTLTVCCGSVAALNGDQAKSIALMQATMMAVSGRRLRN